MSIDFKVALIVSDLRGFELAGFIIQLTLIELYRNMMRSQNSKVFFLKITNPLSGEQKVTNHKTDPNIHYNANTNTNIITEYTKDLKDSSLCLLAACSFVSEI